MTATLNIDGHFFNSNKRSGSIFYARQRELGIRVVNKMRKYKKQ